MSIDPGQFRDGMHHQTLNEFLLRAAFSQLKDRLWPSLSVFGRHCRLLTSLSAFCQLRSSASSHRRRDKCAALSTETDDQQRRSLFGWRILVRQHNQRLGRVSRTRPPQYWRVVGPAAVKRTATADGERFHLIVLCCSLSCTFSVSL